MDRVIIGNVISFVAAFFLCMSGIAKSKSGIYFFQYLECVCLIISQLVFLQVAGAVSMLFGAVRNYLASKDKYSLRFMVLIFFAIGALGFILNTGGAIGLIPVFASLFVTVTACLVKSFPLVRITVIINLAMWVVYSILILDVVTAVTNFVALIINTVTLILYKRKHEVSP